jgi:hypothetical protein
MDNFCIYPGDSCIIPEPAILPFSSIIAASRISPAVVNSSIKSYVGTPIAPMPNIHSIVESPIRRSPEPADLWRKYPYAGNPIISHLRIKSPVSGYPKPTIHGAKWLLIYRQRWWGNFGRYGNAEFDLSCRIGFEGE